MLCNDDNLCGKVEEIYNGDSYCNNTAPQPIRNDQPLYTFSRRSPDNKRFSILDDDFKRVSTMKDNEKRAYNGATVGFVLTKSSEKKSIQ